MVMTRLKATEEDALSLPATPTVKLLVPALPGVPLITPFPLRVNPAGKVPDTKDHV